MANIGFVQTLTAQEVTDMENGKKEEEAKLQFQIIDNLSQYVNQKWDDAKEAKVTIEEQMIKSMLQRRGEYTPKKLAEIREVEQPEIFMNITGTKCRNAVAWIKDIIFTPKDKIFSVEPTPIPELPDFVVEKIQKQVIEKFLQMAAMQMQTTGKQMETEELRNLILEQQEVIQERVHQSIIQESRKRADELSKKIDDDFREGGFYKALDLVIDDIVEFKAGIIKGIVFRKERVKKTVMGPDGRLKNEISYKVVPKYERRSPFCIFPSPRSVHVDNGYLFDVLSVKPSSLYDLIGVDGYDEKEIRNVLREFNGGTLNNKWLELSQDAMDGMGEDRPDNPTSQYPEEKIYCLELWDEIPGGLLKEWGLKEIDDEDKNYSCCIWKIGNHVIKAMLNYDKMGRKPYHKTSFQNVNDSFWGDCIPELIADCQQVCNACARSIVANVGIGSLPQVGLNVDRLEPNASRKIWNGKIWPFTEEQMASGSKPLEFYQPQMVTEQLINVYGAFSKIADEHSGVPAYAHGNPSVGGGGDTASGLNLLITQAARGIKAVVRNIDIDLITSALEYHYDYLLDNVEVYGLLGDYKMVARGTSALLAKEQMAVRKVEYLNNTANPVDIQLLGAKNRRKVLFSVAKDFGLDVDENELPDPQQLIEQQPPAENPGATDAAGNPAQGTDDRQFNQQRPRMGVSG